MPLRSYSEAEIVLKARRRLERPLLVMVWLGVVAFSLSQGNVFYLVAGTFAVAVNLLAAHHAKEVYVHRFFVNAGVLAATGILLLELFAREGQLLHKLGNYLILIQLCKLFERKGNRDYLQMIALSVLLVVSATLYCSEFWFALLLVVYAALACYTAMVFTLKRELDSSAQARLVTEASPLSASRVAWNVIRDWPTRPLIRSSAIVLITMLVTGVLVFLVAPRQARNLAGAMVPSAGQDSSGYSELVQLGRKRRVKLSGRIVMTVTMLSDCADGPKSPTTYLRGKTFDRYVDSRWTNRMPPYAEPQPAPAEGELAGARVHEISIVSELLPSLFLPANTPHVTAEAGRCQRDANGNAMLTRIPLMQGNIRYTTYSWPAPMSEDQRLKMADRRLKWSRQTSRWTSDGDGAWADDDGPDIYALDQGSNIPPSVRSLAQDWCADLLQAGRAPPDGRNDLKIARRIARRLQQRCRYTLDLTSADPTRDGVEDFLFHMKRGHCEYFASAMTVMCQSLGLRARLVAGFRLTPTAEVGKRQYVRSRDAHAWAEVYTDQTGWVTIDASPAAEADPAVGLWAKVKDFWQTLGFLWYEHVVGYDSHSRNRLARRIGDAAKRAAGSLRGAVRAGKRGALALLAKRQVDRAMLQAALVAGLVALLLEIVLVARLIRRSLRRRKRAPAGGQSAENLQFIQDLFDMLIEHGLTAPQHHTPRRLARRAAEDFNLPRPGLNELVNLYYRVRWGRQPAQREEIHAAKRQVAQIREMLADGGAA